MSRWTEDKLVDACLDMSNAGIQNIAEKYHGEHISLETRAALIADVAAEIAAYNAAVPDFTNGEEQPAELSNGDIERIAREYVEQAEFDGQYFRFTDYDPWPINDNEEN